MANITVKALCDLAINNESNIVEVYCYTTEKVVMTGTFEEIAIGEYQNYVVDSFEIIENKVFSINIDTNIDTM